MISSRSCEIGARSRERIELPSSEDMMEMMAGVLSLRWFNGDQVLVTETIGTMLERSSVL
jgi:hypothetical protein